MNQLPNVEGFMMGVNVEEITDAMKEMKNRKAARLFGLTINILKSDGENKIWEL